MTLAEFLAGLAGGTLTYPVAQWVFYEIQAWEVELSPKQKRAAAYVISFVLATAALAAGAALGYTEITPDSVFKAFTAAFTASQALHALFGMKSA